MKVSDEGLEGCERGSEKKISRNVCRSECWGMGQEGYEINIQAGAGRDESMQRRAGEENMWHARQRVRRAFVLQEDRYAVCATRDRHDNGMGMGERNT